MELHLEHVKQIERNLAGFQRLRYSPEALPRYELLSDALMWDDEKPRSDIFIGDIDFLRFLWRYRIVHLQPSVAVSEPLWEIMKADWEIMKGKCPSWPGFRPERCENMAIIKTYEEMKKKADESNPFPEW